MLMPQASIQLLGLLTCLFFFQRFRKVIVYVYIYIYIYTVYSIYIYSIYAHI